LQKIENNDGYFQFVLNFPPELYVDLDMENKYFQFKLATEDGFFLIPREKNGKKLYKVMQVGENTYRITISRPIVSLMDLKKGDKFEYSVIDDAELGKEVIYLQRVDKDGKIQ